MEKMIHVRFSPDSTVTDIGDRPADLTPQEWFDHLSRAGANYEALSGGRGLFRLANGDLEALTKTVMK